MSKHTMPWQQVVIGIVLGLVVIVQLLVPVNPDQTLPAIPELLSIALLSGILCMVFSGRILQASDWSFRPWEAGVLSLLWLTVLLVTGSRAVFSLFHTPGQVWTPCRIAPGISTKLECLFQASITQNYGFRTFFMLLTAVMLGTLAFLIARSVRHGWQLLLGAVVSGPLFVTTVSFFCMGFGIEQALPKSLFHNDWGSQRLTQVFGNPGWVWPYFAPGLAVILWATVTASTRTGRILGAGLSTLLILGVLATEQRGGLLLCLLYLAVCGFYYLTRGFRSRSLPILALGAIVLVVLGDGVYAVVNNQKLLQVIAQAIGYNWKANPAFVDLPRMMIWQAAGKLFEESPLFGHGYASWFQLISAYGPKHNMPYVADTAHNLFVQMLVELGLLHTLLILSILVLIALTVWQNSRLLSGGILLLLLAVCSFLVPSLVQEPDYIRPSFYIHAIFWGTLAGLPFYLEKKQGRGREGKLGSQSADGTALRRTDVDPSGDKGAMGKRGEGEYWLRHLLFWWRAAFSPFAFRLLTGLCFVGILWCGWNFSFGGSPFEARLTQSSTSLMRWLGPSVMLPSFKMAEGKVYSVYSTNPVQKPISVDLTEAGSKIRLTVEGQDEFALALENGERFWPQRHHLSFSTAQPDGTRWISTQVFYPPQQSNLGIGWSRNMYPWENFGGLAGRWCDQDCVFVAKSCGRRDRLDFAVHSPRPDYAETNPLFFQVSVYSLPEGSEFSSQVLQHLPSSMAWFSSRLEKQGESKQFHFDGIPGTAWYFVHLQAASIFNPKSQGLSQDNRNLSVVVSETLCASSTTKE